MRVQNNQFPELMKLDDEIQDMNEEAERAALEASIAKAEMAEKKQALEALKARRKS